jgi:alkanesulfonate monooxygenase SsuD/methylene tetrahydromethanopterin reductase-like flavin-dependent oxidoreductase (luciferase family)
VAPSFRFGVNAHRTPSGEDWSTLCRKAENLGFATVALPDHPSVQAVAPVVDGLTGT